MTDPRDRGSQDPRDRPDAPPDPESGAPVPVPSVMAPHAEHPADADIEAALARGDDIHEAVPAEPERPGAGALALSLLLPGAGQIVAGRLAIGGALLLAWGVLLGVVALGYEPIRMVADTGSL
ncbi:MAG: hypothetical protein ACREKM_06305, partial [Longimicrobiales bacterium]